MVQGNGNAGKLVEQRQLNAPHLYRCSQVLIGLLHKQVNNVLFAEFHGRQQPAQQQRKKNQPEKQCFFNDSQRLNNSEYEYFAA
ncbi:hypothetical protein PK28_02385 [Hymenobacter sp. DG25B]|nr:hypothetical protein PK28_02385 [Hymenobacter sp. DG25B]